MEPLALVVRWSPRGNAQRNLHKRFPEWFVVRFEAGRVLLCSSPVNPWREGELQWIEEDQVQ